MVAAKDLALASVALLVAYFTPSLNPLIGGTDGTGALGPPPRDKMTRPILDEVDAKLRHVRTTSRGAPCQEFLSASYAIITIFDALTGMQMVKKDMIGNCDKIWKLQTKERRTLQQMCDDEIDALNGDADAARKKDGSVCNSLLWLKRALRLVEGILQELVRDTKKKLKDCVTASYARSLKRHHNMVMKGVFGAAVNAAPDRAAFVKKLAPRLSEAAALKTVARLVVDFGKPLDSIEKHLIAKKIER